jgi:hypothetical protein
MASNLCCRLHKEREQFDLSGHLLLRASVRP